jgi:hypothetical protein
MTITVGCFVFVDFDEIRTEKIVPAALFHRTGREVLASNHLPFTPVHLSAVVALKSSRGVDP